MITLLQINLGIIPDITVVPAIAMGQYNPAVSRLDGSIAYCHYIPAVRHGHAPLFRWHRRLFRHFPALVKNIDAGSRRCQRICLVSTLQGVINKIISYHIACRQNSRYEYDNNSSPTPFPIVVHHNHHFPYCELPRYNAFALISSLYF